MKPPSRRQIAVGVGVAASIAVLLLVRPGSSISGLSAEDVREIRKEALPRTDLWSYLRQARASVGWPNAVAQTCISAPRMFRENLRYEIGGIDVRADGSVAARVLRDGRHRITWILEKRKGHWEIVGTKNENHAASPAANQAAAVDAPITPHLYIIDVCRRSTAQRRYVLRV